MSNQATQAFSVLPCPHTGLRRWLVANLSATVPAWTLHRADGTSGVVDLCTASDLRVAFGD